MKLIIDIIIYTFSIFGIIIFFSDMIFGYKKRKVDNKVVLIFEKSDEDFEETFRNILYFIKSRGLAKDIYILFENEDDKNIEIAEKFARDSNIFVAHDKQQLFIYATSKNIHNY